MRNPASTAKRDRYRPSGMNLGLTDGLWRLARNGLRFRALMPQKDPVQQSPIHEQADQRHRAEVHKKVAISNPGNRSDQNVLRIAGDRCYAADVGSRRQREQVGQRLQAHPLADAQHQRRHDQADHIVHQECRQNAAGEHHAGQQMPWTQVLDHQMSNPLEESRQVQAGDNQHHGEKQDQRREVDALDGRLWREHAEDEHAYRPNDRHRGTVDLRARQMSDGEDEVARQENEPGNDNMKVRQGVADG